MHKYLVVALVAAQIVFISACSQVSKTASAEPHAAVPEAKSDKDVLQLSEQQIVRGQINTEKIRSGTLQENSEFSSVVEAPSDQIGVVSPQINGIVTRVNVDVGDFVRKGQVLLYISSPDLADAQAAYFHAVSRLQEARSQASLIKTRLAIAQKDVQRFDGLVNDGIAAKRELEGSQTREANTNAELVSSEAAANAAEAQLNAARIRLAALGMKDPKTKPVEFTSDLALISPSAGVVLQRNISPGQGVGPASALNQNSKPFISIANLQKVWVMLEVPQSQVPDLKLGDSVKFRSELVPGQIFEGRITRLGENFDLASHCVQVRTEIDNRGGRLKPGTLVIADVNASGTSNSGLLVPKTALQNVNGEDCVFCQVGKRQFKKFPVQLISSSSRDAVVRGKLPANASVVSGGAFYLKTELVKASMGADE